MTFLLVSAAAFFLIEMTYVTLAKRHGIQDIPNQRSSHTRLTPRGGGIIFPLAALAAGVRDPSFAMLAGGAIVVAAVGFIDDLRGLKASVRLFVHIVAAALVLILPGKLENSALLALLIFLIVYSTNTFNFMDGIDGLVTGISLVGLGYMSFAALQFSQNPAATAFLLIVAGSVAAFLLFNFPPAKVFMGDVGSGFLGFFLAATAAWLGIGDPLWIFAALILFTCIFADSGLTLFVRLLRKENIFQPHRTHAYQHLNKKWGGTHRPVTLLYMAYTMFWCGPLSLACFLHPQLASYFLLSAYLPFLAFCYWARAGHPDLKPT